MTTSIEWTVRVLADGRILRGESWNVIAGCKYKSDGCLNCYAAHMALRLEAMGQLKYAGTAKKIGNRAVFTNVLHYDHAALLKPFHWKGHRVFVNSMADVWHEDVPWAFIDQMFAVMALCPTLTFQILTKRTQRMADYTTDPATPARIQAAMPSFLPHAKQPIPDFCWPLPNVWLGTTVEHHSAWIERRDHLERTIAAIRFLSCEPLLSSIPLDLPVLRWASAEPGESSVAFCRRMGWQVGDRVVGLHGRTVGMDGTVEDSRQVYRIAGLDDTDPTGVRLLGADEILRTRNMAVPGFRPDQHGPECAWPWARVESFVDWIIVGGESGHNARPMHPSWPRQLRDQGWEAGVPTFYKQTGRWIMTDPFPAPKDVVVDARGVITADVVQGSTLPTVNCTQNAFGLPKPAQLHATDRQRRIPEEASAGEEVAMRARRKHDTGAILDGREWKAFPVLPLEAQR